LFNLKAVVLLRPGLVVDEVGETAVLILDVHGHLERLVVVDLVHDLHGLHLGDCGRYSVMVPQHGLLVGSSVLTLVLLSHVCFPEQVWARGEEV